MTNQSVYITASVDNSKERHGIRAYIESYGRPALKIGDPKTGKQIVTPCTTFRRHASAKPRKGTKGDGPDGSHPRGRGTKKAPVVGAVQRDGSVTAKAVRKDRMKGKHLRAFVRHRVDTERAALITDEYTAYRGMSRVLPHAVIKHSDWYVDGDIHTNTIEGFWALLKRGMFGQFHSVSKRHLQRYVDEFCYRYNLQNADPLAAFDLTINRGLGVAR